MFFHARVFFQSILFLSVLEIATSEYLGNEFASRLTGGKSLMAVVLFVAIVFLFYFFSRKLAPKVNLHVIIPIFFVSSFSLLYFVNSKIEQHFLIGILTVAYYFIQFSIFRLNQYEKDETGLGIFAAGNVATMFLFYAFTLAAYLNFAIPLWILMGLYLFITTIVSYKFFSLIVSEKKKAVNFAFVMGFVMAEIVWVVNFWPFGYLTTASITLIFYYVFWDMMQSNFLGKLSKKRVIAHLVLLSCMVILVLTSTHWLPVF
jgi:hypothetical protein